MASKIGQGSADGQLSVSNALKELDRLRQISSSSVADSGSTGGVAYRGKVTVPGFDQLSNEGQTVGPSTGTGFSTRPQSDLMNAIETGDRNTAIELRGEIALAKSKVWTTASTIALTVSLAASAIIIAVVLYLHSDLKVEQKALEDRIMSIVSPMQKDLSTVTQALRQLVSNPDGKTLPK